jgi:hypothetical protein
VLLAFSSSLSNEDFLFIYLSVCLWCLLLSFLPIFVSVSLSVHTYCPFNMYFTSWLLRNIVMNFRTLSCWTALYCSSMLCYAFFCTALHCKTPNCTILHYSTLYILYFSILYCNFGTVLYLTVLTACRFSAPY